MDQIFANHKHWIRIVEKFGGRHYAEDIVQEAYIKVLKLNKEINEAYFYFTLRSLTMQLHKHNVVKVEITSEIEYELVDEEYEDFTFEKIKPYIDLINTWPEYDKLLYLCWVRQNISIRKLSREIGISFDSVYHTITNCKKRIKLWQDQEKTAARP